MKLIKLGKMRYFQVKLFKRYEFGWLWIAGQKSVRFVRGAIDAHGVFKSMKPHHS